MRGAQQPISARVLASAAGTILDDSDFYPYGGERPITSSSGNRYKFEGKEQEQQQAQQGATQQQQQAQTQQLSAEDVTKVIQQAQKSSSDPVSTGMQIFNNLGNNVTVSGDVLRQAVKDTGVTVSGAAGDLISHADRVTKSGSDVTITSKSKFDTNQNGILCLRPSTQIIPRLIDWATCSNGRSAH